MFYMFLSLVLLSFIPLVVFFGLCVPSLLSLGFHSFDTLFLYERDPKRHRPDRDTGLDSEWHHEYHI